MRAVEEQNVQGGDKTAVKLAQGRDRMEGGKSKGKGRANSNGKGKGKARARDDDADREVEGDAGDSEDSDGGRSGADIEEGEAAASLSSPLVDPALQQKSATHAMRLGRSQLDTTSVAPVTVKTSPSTVTARLAATGSGASPPAGPSRSASEHTPHPVFGAPEDTSDTASNAALFSGAPLSLKSKPRLVEGHRTRGRPKGQTSRNRFTFKSEEDLYKHDFSGVPLTAIGESSVLVPEVPRRAGAQAAK